MQDINKIFIFNRNNNYPAVNQLAGMHDIEFQDREEQRMLWVQVPPSIASRPSSAVAWQYPTSNLDIHELGEVQKAIKHRRNDPSLAYNSFKVKITFNRTHNISGKFDPREIEKEYNVTAADIAKIYFTLKPYTKVESVWTLTETTMKVKLAPNNYLMRMPYNTSIMFGNERDNVMYNKGAMSLWSSLCHAANKASQVKPVNTRLTRFYPDAQVNPLLVVAKDYPTDCIGTIRNEPRYKPAPECPMTKLELDLIDIEEDLAPLRGDETVQSEPDSPHGGQPVEWSRTVTETFSDLEEEKHPQPKEEFENIRLLAAPIAPFSLSLIPIQPPMGRVVQPRSGAFERIAGTCIVRIPNPHNRSLLPQPHELPPSDQ